MLNKIYSTYLAILLVLNCFFDQDYRPILRKINEVSTLVSLLVILFSLLPFLLLFVQNTVAKSMSIATKTPFKDLKLKKPDWLWIGVIFVLTAAIQYFIKTRYFL